MAIILTIIFCLLASVLLVFFLLSVINRSPKQKNKKVVYSFKQNLNQESKINYPNFIRSKNFNLGPKQKVALSENICLVFADEKPRIINLAEERIKLCSKENEKILVISSLLDFKEIPNLTNFKTEDFLWKYSNSYFKFDFDSVIFCCEYPYNRLRKFIKEAIRSCDKVFLSIIDKTEIILNDFKTIGKEFVLINFKKPYQGGIKKFEKTIKIFEDNLLPETIKFEEVWTKRKYKPEGTITINYEQRKFDNQNKIAEIPEKIQEEIIALPEQTENLVEDKPLEKKEIYSEPLITNSKSNINLSRSISVYVSDEKEKSLKEKLENLFKDNEEQRILLVTYHTSKFTELFADLLITKKLKIINPWILKNLKKKEDSILESEIVCFDEFYIDSKGIFFDIIKLFLENHKKIFGVVNKKEFNSEAGIKFKNDFFGFIEPLIETNKNTDEEEGLLNEESL